MSQVLQEREHRSVISRLNPDRARVSYRAGPHQAERRELQLDDDSTVSFGRGQQCEVRFGHAPTRDGEIPRVAGWLVMAHGRVFVEAAPMSDEQRTDRHDTTRDGSVDLRSSHARRALQVAFDGGPPVPIAPGSAYAPAAPVFTVEVVGATQVWELDVVTVDRSGASDDRTHDDPRTNSVSVELTEQQHQVLLAYAEPVLAGGVEPATHDQVAAQVFMSRSAVRRVLDRISDEFYNKRLWTPDSADTRVRVVEAARHNQLIRRAPAP